MDKLLIKIGTQLEGSQLLTSFGSLVDKLQKEANKKPVDMRVMVDPKEAEALSKQLNTFSKKELGQLFPDEANLKSIQELQAYISSLEDSINRINGKKIRISDLKELSQLALAKDADAKTRRDFIDQYQTYYRQQHLGEKEVLSANEKAVTDVYEQLGKRNFKNWMPIDQIESLNNLTIKLNDNYGTLVTEFMKSSQAVQTLIEALGMLEQKSDAIATKTAGEAVAGIGTGSGGGNGSGNGVGSGGTGTGTGNGIETGTGTGGGGITSDIDQLETLKTSIETINGLIKQKTEAIMRSAEQMGISTHYEVQDINDLKQSVIGVIEALRRMASLAASTRDFTKSAIGKDVGGFKNIATQVKSVEENVNGIKIPQMVATGDKTNLKDYVSSISKLAGKAEELERLSKALLDIGVALEGINSFVNVPEIFAGIKVGAKVGDNLLNMATGLSLLREELEKFSLDSQNLLGSLSSLAQQTEALKSLASIFKSSQGGTKGTLLDKNSLIASLNEFVDTSKNISGFESNIKPELIKLRDDFDNGAIAIDKFIAKFEELQAETKKYKAFKGAPLIGEYDNQASAINGIKQYINDQGFKQNGNIVSTSDLEKGITTFKAEVIDTTGELQKLTFIFNENFINDAGKGIGKLSVQMDGLKSKLTKSDILTTVEAFKDLGFKNASFEGNKKAAIDAIDAISSKFNAGEISLKEYKAQVDAVIGSYAKFEAMGAHSFGTKTFNSVQELQSALQNKVLNDSQGQYKKILSSSINEKNGTVTMNVQTFDNQVQTLTAHLNEAGNAVYSITKSTQGFSRLGKMLDTLKSKFASITAYWTAMYLNPYRIIAGIKSIVEEASKFQAVLTNINYTMDVSQKSLDNMGETAIETAKQLGTSIDNISQVLKVYSNMTTSTKEMLEQATPTIILSNLSGQDANTSADQLQGIKEQFDLTEDSYMHIVDVMDYLSSQIKMDFSKGISVIAESTSTAGLTAKQAGMNFETFAATVAKTAEKTRQSGSEIGNAMKMIMTRISKVGDTDDEPEEASKAAESLAKVGINIYNTKGEMQSMSETLSQLSAKWDNLNDAQKSNIAYNVAGTRQINTLKAVLDSYAESEDLAASMAEANGEAQKDQSKYTESLAGKIQTLSTSFEALKISIGDNEGIKDLIGSFTDIVNSLNSVIKKLGVFKTALYGIAAFMATKGKFFTFQPMLNGSGEMTRSLQFMGRDVNQGYLGKAGRMLWNDRFGLRGHSLLTAANNRFHLTYGSVDNQMLSPIRVFDEQTANNAISAFQGKYANAQEFYSAMPQNIKNSNYTTFANYVSSQPMNELTGKGLIEAQKSYNAEIAKTNQNLKMTTLEGKLASGSMNLLSTAMNMLVGVGIGIAINALLSGLSKLNNHAKELIETQKQLNDEYSEFKKTNSEQIKSLEDQKDEFERLSEGVDAYGNNISLTSDEYARYKEIVKEVLGYSPSLIEGYNKEGDAIARKNGLLEQSIDLLNEEARKQAANRANDINNRYAATSTKNDGGTWWDKILDSWHTITGDTTSNSTDSNVLLNKLYGDIPYSILNTHPEEEAGLRKILEYLGIDEKYFDLGKEYTGILKDQMLPLVDNYSIEELTNVFKLALEEQNIDPDKIATHVVDFQNYISSLKKEISYVKDNDLNSYFIDAMNANKNYSGLSDIAASFMNMIGKNLDVYDENMQLLPKEVIVSYGAQLSEAINQIVGNADIEEKIKEAMTIPHPGEDGWNADGQTIEEWAKWYKEAIIKILKEAGLGQEIIDQITKSLFPDINELEAASKKSHTSTHKKLGDWFYGGDTKSKNSDKADYKYDVDDIWKQLGIDTTEEIELWDDIVERVNTATEAMYEYQKAKAADQAKTAFDETKTTVDSLVTGVTSMTEKWRKYITIADVVNEKQYLTDEEMQDLIKTFPKLKDKLKMTTHGWSLESSAMDTVNSAITGLSNTYVESQEIITSENTKQVLERLGINQTELEGITTMEEAYEQLAAIKANLSSTDAQTYLMLAQIIVAGKKAKEVLENASALGKDDDTDEKLAEAKKDAWEKQYDADFQYNIDKANNSLKDFTETIEALSNAFDGLYEHDYTGQMDIMTEKFELQGEYVDSLKNELDALLSTEPETSGSWEKLSSQLDTISESYFESRRDLIEYRNKLTELQGESYKYIADLGKENIEASKNIIEQMNKSAKGESIRGIFGLSGIYNVTEDAVEKQRQDNKELLEEEKNYQSKVSEVRKKATDEAKAYDDKERAEDLQEKLESIDKTLTATKDATKEMYDDATSKLNEYTTDAQKRITEIIDWWNKENSRAEMPDWLKQLDKIYGISIDGTETDSTETNNIPNPLDAINPFKSKFGLAFADGTDGGNSLAKHTGIAGENYKPEILVDKKTGDLTYIDSPTPIDLRTTDVIGEKDTANLDKFEGGTVSLANLDTDEAIKVALDYIVEKFNTLVTQDFLDELRTKYTGDYQTYTDSVLKSWTDIYKKYEENTNTNIKDYANNIIKAINKLAEIVLELFKNLEGFNLSESSSLKLKSLFDDIANITNGIRTVSSTAINTTHTTTSSTSNTGGSGGSGSGGSGGSTPSNKDNTGGSTPSGDNKGTTIDSVDTSQTKGTEKDIGSYPLTMTVDPVSHSGKAQDYAAAWIAEASAQVGYTEGEGDANKFSQGLYDLYQANKDDWDLSWGKGGQKAAEAWCADFLGATGIATFGVEGVKKVFGDVSSWSTEWPKNILNAGGVDHKSNPQPGDVFTTAGSGGNGHVGIIKSVNADGTFTTLEGNAGSGAHYAVEGTRKASQFIQVVQPNWQALADADYIAPTDPPTQNSSTIPINNKQKTDLWVSGLEGLKGKTKDKYYGKPYASVNAIVDDYVKTVTGDPSANRETIYDFSNGIKKGTEGLEIEAGDYIEYGPNGKRGFVVYSDSNDGVMVMSGDVLEVHPEGNNPNQQVIEHAVDLKDLDYTVYKPNLDAMMDDTKAVSYNTKMANPFTEEQFQKDPAIMDWQINVDPNTGKIVGLSSPTYKTGSLTDKTGHWFYELKDDVDNEALVKYIEDNYSLAPYSKHGKDGSVAYTIPNDDNWFRYVKDSAGYSLQKDLMGDSSTFFMDMSPINSLFPAKGINLSNGGLFPSTGGKTTTDKEVDPHAEDNKDFDEPAPPAQPTQPPKPNGKDGNPPKEEPTQPPKPIQPPTVLPTILPTATPIPTVAPTEAPKPTETPSPTPEPTETPKPTEEPKKGAGYISTADILKAERDNANKPKETPKPTETNNNTQGPNPWIPKWVTFDNTKQNGSQASTEVTPTADSISIDTDYIKLDKNSVPKTADFVINAGDSTAKFLNKDLEKNQYNPNKTNYQYWQWSRGNYDPNETVVSQAELDKRASIDTLTPPSLKNDGYLIEKFNAWKKEHPENFDQHIGNNPIESQMAFEEAQNNKSDLFYVTTIGDNQDQKYIYQVSQTDPNLTRLFPFNGDEDVLDTTTQYGIEGSLPGEKGIKGSYLINAKDVFPNISTLTPENADKYSFIEGEYLNNTGDITHEKKRDMVSDKLLDPTYYFKNSWERFTYEHVPKGLQPDVSEETSNILSGIVDFLFPSASGAELTDEEKEALDSNAEIVPTLKNDLIPAVTSTISDQEKEITDQIKENIAKSIGADEETKKALQADNKILAEKLVEIRSSVDNTTKAVNNNTNKTKPSGSNGNTPSGNHTPADGVGPMPAPSNPSGGDNSTPTPQLSTPLDDINHMKNRFGLFFGDGTNKGNSIAKNIGFAGENNEPEILMDKNGDNMRLVDSLTPFDKRTTEVAGEKATAKVLASGNYFANGTDSGNTSLYRSLRNAEVIDSTTQAEEENTEATKANTEATKANTEETKIDREATIKAINELWQEGATKFTGTGKSDKELTEIYEAIQDLDKHVDVVNNDTIDEIVAWHKEYTDTIDEYGSDVMLKKVQDETLTYNKALKQLETEGKAQNDKDISAYFDWLKSSNGTGKDMDVAYDAINNASNNMYSYLGKVANSTIDYQLDVYKELKKAREKVYEIYTTAPTASQQQKALEQLKSIDDDIESSSEAIVNAYQSIRDNNTQRFTNVGLQRTGRFRYGNSYIDRDVSQIESSFDYNTSNETKAEAYNTISRYQDARMTNNNNAIAQAESIWQSVLNDPKNNPVAQKQIIYEVVDATGNFNDKYYETLQMLADEGYSEDYREIWKTLVQAWADKVKAQTEAIDDNTAALNKKKEADKNEADMKIDTYLANIQYVTDDYNNRINWIQRLIDGLSSLNSLQKSIRDTTVNYKAILEANKHMEAYLDKDARELLFNDEDYTAITKTMDRLGLEAKDAYRLYKSQLDQMNRDKDWSMKDQYSQQYQNTISEINDRLEIATKELEISNKQLEYANAKKERDTRVILGGRAIQIANPETLYQKAQDQSKAELEKGNLMTDKAANEVIRELELQRSENQTAVNHLSDISSTVNKLPEFMREEFAAKLNKDEQETLYKILSAIDFNKLLSNQDDLITTFNNLEDYEIGKGYITTRDYQAGIDWAYEQYQNGNISKEQFDKYSGLLRTDREEKKYGEGIVETQTYTDDYGQIYNIGEEGQQAIKDAITSAVANVADEYSDFLKEPFDVDQSSKDTIKEKTTDALVNSVYESLTNYMADGSIYSKLTSDLLAPFSIQNPITDDLVAKAIIPAVNSAKTIDNRTTVNIENVNLEDVTDAQDVVNGLVSLATSYADTTGNMK